MNVMQASAKSHSRGSARGTSPSLVGAAGCRPGAAHRPLLLVAQPPAWRVLRFYPEITIHQLLRLRPGDRMSLHQERFISSTGSDLGTECRCCGTGNHQAHKLRSGDRMTLPPDRCYSSHRPPAWRLLDGCHLLRNEQGLLVSRGVE